MTPLARRACLADGAGLSVADVSEAAYEHADLMSTEGPQVPADPPAETLAKTPAETTAETTAETPAETAGALPKPLNPRGAPRPTKRVPGLTGRGVCVLIAAVTFVGGLIDIAASGHRGHLFGVLFAVTSALGALAVRKKDLWVAMVAPPLLYCVLIFLMSLIDQSGLTGGPLTREGFYLGNAFVTGAPAIWIGSLLAGAVGWYRLRPTGARDRR